MMKAAVVLSLCLSLVWGLPRDDRDFPGEPDRRSRSEDRPESATAYFDLSGKLSIGGSRPEPDSQETPLPGKHGDPEAGNLRFPASGGQEGPEIERRDNPRAGFESKRPPGSRGFQDDDRRDFPQPGGQKWSEDDRRDTPRPGGQRFPEDDRRDSPRPGGQRFPEDDRRDTPRPGGQRFPEDDRRDTPRPGGQRFPEDDRRDTPRPGGQRFPEDDRRDTPRPGGQRFPEDDRRNTPRPGGQRFPEDDRRDTPRPGGLRFPEDDRRDTPRPGGQRFPEDDRRDTHRPGGQRFPEDDRRDNPRPGGQRFPEDDRRDNPRPGGQRFPEDDRRNIRRPGPQSFPQKDRSDFSEPNRRNFPPSGHQGFLELNRREFPAPGAQGFVDANRNDFPPPGPQRFPGVNRPDSARPDRPVKPEFSRPDFLQPESQGFPGGAIMVPPPGNQPSLDFSYGSEEANKEARGFSTPGGAASFGGQRFSRPEVEPEGVGFGDYSKLDGPGAESSGYLGRPKRPEYLASEGRGNPGRPGFGSDYQPQGYPERDSMSPEEFQSYEEFKKAAEKKRELEEEERKKNAKFEEFDKIVGAYDEKKYDYVFTVTMEMLKFCQCSELSSDMDIMFAGDGGLVAMNASTKTANSSLSKDPLDSTIAEDHLDQYLKLVYGETDLTPEIFGQITQVKESDLKRMTFAGLVQSLCYKSKSYVSHLKMLKQKVETMSLPGATR